MEWISGCVTPAVSAENYRATAGHGGPKEEETKKKKKKKQTKKKRKKKEELDERGS